MTKNMFWQTRENNFRVLKLFSDLLHLRPDLFSPSDIRALTGDTASVPAQERAALEESAVYGLLTAFFPEHGANFHRSHLFPSLKKLFVKDYTQNPYYKKVRLPSVTWGKWELGYRSYKPYELFVRDDIRFCADGREIPQIGFFDREFRFPAVLEGGREWMTVTPNEIETMRTPIAAARGRVLSYGLGLGYYAFMAAEKEEVSIVTLVERDETVIELFRECILPSFPQKNKIEIIHADALDFAEKEAPKGGYNVLFADIWHDPSDGIPLYLALKAQEKHLPNTECHYWIEKTMLSYLRTKKLSVLEETEKESAEALLCLCSDEALLRDVKEGFFEGLY